MSRVLTASPAYADIKILQSVFVVHIAPHVTFLHGSFIPSRTYPIPLDLGSQAGLGENSTAVGDHVGSPRDELFLSIFYALVIFYDVSGVLEKRSWR